MKIAFELVILLFLWCLMLIIGVDTTPKSWTLEEKTAVIRAMEYHGVQSAVGKENGRRIITYYFRRNSQECMLISWDRKNNCIVERR